MIYFLQQETARPLHRRGRTVCNAGTEIGVKTGGDKTIQRKGRYGGPERRRSPRFQRRFHATLEYEGNAYEISTIDISKSGVLIPRRLPPPIGTHVKLSLTIRGHQSNFEGTVVRHTKCVVNGVQTSGIAIDFPSPEYEEFVKEKIIIS